MLRYQPAGWWLRSVSRTGPRTSWIVRRTRAGAWSWKGERPGRYDIRAFLLRGEEMEEEGSSGGSEGTARRRLRIPFRELATDRRRGGRLQGERGSTRTPPWP